MMRTAIKGCEFPLVFKFARALCGTLTLPSVCRAAKRHGLSCCYTKQISRSGEEEEEEEEEESFHLIEQESLEGQTTEDELEESNTSGETEASNVKIPRKTCQAL